MNDWLQWAEAEVERLHKRIAEHIKTRRPDEENRYYKMSDEQEALERAITYTKQNYKEEQ